MSTELPCFGFKYQVEGGSGWISSDLSDDRSSEHDTPTTPFDVGVDAIESMVLAHAVAGVDIHTPAYIEGIETAVFALMNNHTN